MFIRKPSEGDYAGYQQNYIDKVEEGDILVTLSRQVERTVRVLERFKENGDLRYGDDKWSVKQVIQHMIDAERVFSYRVMCLARADTTHLPGFNENAYADVAKVGHRTIEDLISELVAVRSGTYSLVRSLTEECIERDGITSGYHITVPALLYVTAGHVEHHLRILEERYAPLL